MSVFPQHYAEWDTPSQPLKSSRINNDRRYARHVAALRPYLSRLNESSTVSTQGLEAICLQEVDIKLVHLISEVLEKSYPRVCIAPRALATSPYVKQSRHPDLAYHMLTLVPKHHCTPMKIGYQAYKRFAVTPLHNLTLVNTHISWTTPPDSESDNYHQEKEKYQRTLRTVSALKAACLHQQALRPRVPLVVCGDLNLSSSANRSMYAQVFGLHRWNQSNTRVRNKTLQLRAIGESYNVNLEDIDAHTTFAELAKDPDDGILCDARWELRTNCESVRSQTLPVDAYGFVPPEQGRGISDHALVEVQLKW